MVQLVDKSELAIQITTRLPRSKFVALQENLKVRLGWVVFDPLVIITAVILGLYRLLVSRVLRSVWIGTKYNASVMVEGREATGCGFWPGLHCAPRFSRVKAFEGARSSGFG